MLITLLKIWTGYLPSTGLLRLVQNLSHQKPEKKKKQKKKGNKRRITASDKRRKRARVICRYLGGTPLENDCEPEIYGILQLQSIEEETCFLICSPQKRTKLACVIDCIPTVFLEKLLNLFRTFAAEVSSHKKISLVISLPIEIVVQLKT